jgi:hypothetical protein
MEKKEMTAKDALSKIRGWFPKEPKLPINQKSLVPIGHSAYRWTATILVIGTFAGALLGVLGSLLGLTDGVYAFLWPIMVGLITGFSTAAVAIYETHQKQRPKEQ